jgi:hypothetical protein
MNIEEGIKTSYDLYVNQIITKVIKLKQDLKETSPDEIFFAIKNSIF